jgi:multicomponent Na+:H+ antiporter subunit E
MKTKLWIILTLFSFWGLLSGFNEITQFGIGLLVALLVTVWLSDSLIKDADFGHLNKGFLKAYFLFFIHWLKDLILANIEVARIVLSKNMDIQPNFYTLKQPHQSSINQTVIANAITLTPGTLTVAFDDEMILIHALRTHHYEDIKTSKTFEYLKNTEKAL